MAEGLEGTPKNTAGIVVRVLKQLYSTFYEKMNGCTETGEHQTSLLGGGPQKMDQGKQYWPFWLNAVASHRGSSLSAVCFPTGTVGVLHQLVVQPSFSSWFVCHSPLESIH